MGSIPIGSTFRTSRFTSGTDVRYRERCRARDPARREGGRAELRVPLALAALVVALLLVAPLADATSPGTNGRIALMRKDSTDHWQIWIADSRLGTARKRTSAPADSGWAVWSPDGRKLAFDSARADSSPNDSSATNDIFTMNADGSGVTKLTDSVGSSADAAWSPDGSLIAFDSDRGRYPSQQGIYVMRSDGSNVRRITTLPANAANDLAPRFSPDGSRLVFTRYRGKDQSEKAALFTVRLDGTQRAQLTPFALHAGDADWSPDGRRLVFEAYPNPAAFGNVYVIGANGHDLRNLTHNPVGKAGSADPVWSPDGKKILFLDNRTVAGVGKTGLATMNPDGSARLFLSRRSVESHQPDWETAR
jgi:Tol biopolymer transport system component